MNKANAATMVVTLLIALVVGGVVLTTAQEHFQDQREAMEDRAVEVYANYTDGHTSQGDSIALNVPVPVNQSQYNATELIRKHLYVTGYSYSINDLYWQYEENLSQNEIKTVLQSLEQRGVVDSGYVSRYFFPTKMWIHAEHGDLPDTWYRPHASIMPIFAGVFILALIVVYVYGLLNREENHE